MGTIDYRDDQERRLGILTRLLESYAQEASGEDFDMVSPHEDMVDFLADLRIWMKLIDLDFGGVLRDANAAIKHYPDERPSDLLRDRDTSEDREWHISRQQDQTELHWDLVNKVLDQKHQREVVARIERDVDRTPDQKLSRNQRKKLARQKHELAGKTNHEPVGVSSDFMQRRDQLRKRLRRA